LPSQRYTNVFARTFGTLIIIEQTWEEIGKTTENTMWVNGPRKDLTKKGFLEHGLGAEGLFRVFLELLKDLHYGIVQADVYIKKGTGVKKEGEEEIKRKDEEEIKKKDEEEKKDEEMAKKEEEVKPE